jgi:hypothetical protein
MMVQINQDRGICVVASKRYGKTTLLRSLLAELSQKYTVIIYNTNYENFDDIKNDNLAAFEPDPKRVHSIEYLSKVIKTLRAHQSNFVIVIIDIDAFFEGIGTMTIKADELRDLYGTGGHQRILPIIEVKAPKYVPTKILDNSNLFYIGNFRDLDNQDRLRNYASREELSSLDRHQFIEVDSWTGRRCLVQVQNGEIITLRELNNMGDANEGLRNIREPEEIASGEAAGEGGGGGIVAESEEAEAESGGGDRGGAKAKTKRSYPKNRKSRAVTKSGGFARFVERRRRAEEEAKGNP